MKEHLKKIIKLLPKKQKKSIIFLGVILFVGMVFEILGLGILIPALSFILSPNEIEEFKENFIYYDFSNFSYEEFILAGMFLVISTYLVRSIVLIIITFNQYKIIESLSSFLSITLFKKYIHQPYLYHTQRDLSEIIKNLQIEINHFTVVCRAILNMTIEIILSASILLTIYFIEPFGALIVSVFFGTLAYIYFFFTKKGIKKWGLKRQEIDKVLSKTIMDSLSGIKDVKLLSKEFFFLSKYISKIKERIIISTYRQTVTHSSRYYLELITVFGVILLIYFLLIGNKTSSEIITTLGIFVAATFRIIPSLNKIISSLQNIRYYSPSINLIYNEFNKTIYRDNSLVKTKKLNSLEKLEIKDLKFNFKRKEVLKNINFQIKKGQIIGIIGSSGSGKTTFIDIINGLLKPDSGQILINDFSILNNEKSLMELIGYVGQDIFLIDDTIISNIAFGIDTDKVNKKALENAINSSKLDELVKELPEGIYSRVGERGVQLSGGQRQRIGIARALYRDPQLLIFDEATASLDNNTEELVIKSIINLKREKMIIMVAHRLSTLVNCDKVFEIKEGGIIEVDIKTLSKNENQ